MPRNKYNPIYAAKYRERNKERISAYFKAYRQRPEFIERERVRSAARNADPIERAGRLRYLREYDRGPKARFKHLISTSNRRGIEVSITFDEYLQLTAGGICTYGCGNPLPKKGSGLDRINSSKGYVIGNVVPCCFQCNVMRGKDVISHEEMFEVIAFLRQYRADLRWRWALQSSRVEASASRGPESPLDGMSPQRVM